MAQFCRSKPLKLCLLFSHTHLTKAVKSMVGMVSDSRWRTKVEFKESVRLIGEKNNELNVFCERSLWCGCCINTRPAWISPVRDICCFKSFNASRLFRHYFCVSFLSEASPGAGAAAVQRQRPRLLADAHPGVDKRAALEASGLSRVPGSARWDFSGIKPHFTSYTSTLIMINAQVRRMNQCKNPELSHLILLSLRQVSICARWVRRRWCWRPESRPAGASCISLSSLF